jgi:hypothetical protein
LGGVAAIILVVGVATAAYFVSNKISGRQAVAPTAPESEPLAKVAEGGGGGGTTGLSGAKAGVTCGGGGTTGLSGAKAGVTSGGGGTTGLSGAKAGVTSGGGTELSGAKAPTEEMCKAKGGTCMGEDVVASSGFTGTKLGAQDCENGDVCASSPGGGTGSGGTTTTTKKTGGGGGGNDGSGGTQTTTTTTTTTTVVNGTCSELKIFLRNSDGSLNSSPLTAAQLANLKINDILVLSTTGSMASLKARFKVTFNGTVEQPEWKNSTGYQDSAKMTSIYDYKITKSGTYLFESQVSTQP